MSGAVKNQHYIPQMYLKRFASVSKKINLWDIHSGNILLNQQTRNFAARRYYYDAPKIVLTDVLSEMRQLFPSEVDSLLQSGNEQLIENALCRSETDISRILDQLDYNPAIMHESQSMSKIVIFLHDLAYRSEAFRDTINKVHDITANYFEGTTLNEHQITEKDPGKRTQLYYLSGLKPLLHTAEVLSNYSWYYGIVQDNLSLLVSDNPAQAIALGFNDICIPISGQRAIVLRINDSNAPLISTDLPCGDIIQLSNQSVLAYNTLQFSFAKRYMFGDKKMLEILRAICIAGKVVGND